MAELVVSREANYIDVFEPAQSIRVCGWAYSGQQSHEVKKDLNASNQSLGLTSFARQAKNPTQPGFLEDPNKKMKFPKV